MAGVKGKSGRHTHYEEMDTVEIVKLSQRTIKAYLSDKKIPIEKKVLIAKDFALRAMPVKQEVKGDLFGSAETAKVIAGLSSADLESLIALGRERKGETKSV